MRCHLSWHLALFELARGNSERARAIYLDSIRPSVALSAPMLSLADAASFLWRWKVYGIVPEMDHEWLEVVGHARRHFPRASLAFADLHAGFAEAATQDVEGVRSRVIGLYQLADEDRLPPGRMAPALCEGAAALARGDNAEAARVLEAVLPELPRIGGSHAQREVFEDSLVLAYLRSGQPAKAADCYARGFTGGRPIATTRGWPSATETSVTAYTMGPTPGTLEWPRRYACKYGPRFGRPC